MDNRHRKLKLVVTELESLRRQDTTSFYIETFGSTSRHLSLKKAVELASSLCALFTVWRFLASSWASHDDTKLATLVRRAVSQTKSVHQSKTTSNDQVLGPQLSGRETKCSRRKREEGETGNFCAHVQCTQEGRNFF